MASGAQLSTQNFGRASIRMGSRFLTIWPGERLPDIQRLSGPCTRTLTESGQLAGPYTRRSRPIPLADYPVGEKKEERRSKCVGRRASSGQDVCG